MAESIEPVALAERLARGERVGVVDVRNRDEFEQWHVDGPGANVFQIPHAKFLQAQVRGGAADLVSEVPQPIVTVCAVGEASDHAAELLRNSGLDATNLAGGMEAWAEVLLSRDLDAPDGAQIRQYHRPATGCLGHLVVDDGEAVVVDPLQAFADRYPEHAVEMGADLRYAVDTHVHADHLSGVGQVAAATEARPATAAGAWKRGFGRDDAVDQDYLGLADGDVLELGESTTIRAIHAPGHTVEMTALLVERAAADAEATATATADAGEEADADAGAATAAEVSPDAADRPGTLLAGDSLFVDGVARPDLEAEVEPAEAAGRLHDTLRTLRDDLPGGTLLAPGHVKPDTPPTADGTFAATLSELWSRLDVLDLDREAFVEQLAADLPPPPANAERIVAANLGIDPVEDPDEIELGPNNCAA